MSSDVKKNVQVCQGIDSYDDMVHDATQRFPELKDVEEPLGFIADKYDLDSYPEFPLSYVWDCDEDEDCDDEEDDYNDVGENYEEEDVGEDEDDDNDVGENYEEEDVGDDDEDDDDDDYDDYDDYDDDEEEDNNDYDDDNEDEENEDDNFDEDENEDGDYNDYNEDEDGDGENEDDDYISTTSSDMDEEVEEQAADAVEQLLPEFVNSFIVLNSSTSLNYIFSPVITLPVPYKKDDAYSDCSLRPLCNSGSSARPEDSDI